MGCMYIYIALYEFPIVGFGNDFAIEGGGCVRHVVACYDLSVVGTMLNVVGKRMMAKKDRAD